MERRSSAHTMTLPRTYTLASGLRIIHLPVDSPVVYCGYAIAAGARHEAENEYGLAHFCEHMTFKGTARLSSLQVINTLERIGGELNAFTTKEDTFFYAAVLREHFAKAVTLLTDIVFHSTYPQEEIDKEVEVVCDEIESYNDTPADLIYDEFENVIYEGEDLGHNILGETERVRLFKTDDCLRFTRKHYRPDNSVFYVMGDIDGKRLVKRLSEAFADTDVLDKIVDESERNDDEMKKNRKECGANVCGKTIIKEIDSHQAHVMVGTSWKFDNKKDALKDASMALLNNMLGGPSMNSRLNLSLREKRGLVYSVDSSVVTYRDRRLWTTYLGCDPHDVNRCLRLIKNEIVKLQSKPLSPSALRVAKQQMKGQIALASENRENYAIDMAKLFLHRNLLKLNEKTYEKIDAVTAEQLQDTAIRLLNENCLTTLVMK